MTLTNVPVAFIDSTLAFTQSQRSGAEVVDKPVEFGNPFLIVRWEHQVEPVIHCLRTLAHPPIEVERGSHLFTTHLLADAVDGKAHVLADYKGRSLPRGRNFGYTFRRLKSPSASSACTTPATDAADWPSVMSFATCAPSPHLSVDAIQPRTLTVRRSGCDRRATDGWP